MDAGERDFFQAPRAAAEARDTSEADSIVLLEMMVPAELRFISFMRKAVQGALLQLRLPHEIAGDIVLAVGEACNNAVLHAGDDPASHAIHVSCRVYKLTPRTDDVVEIDIRSHGNAFTERIDPSRFDMPDADLLSEHGRGLPLMSTLVDRVQFLKLGSDAVVRLTKNLT